MWTVGGLVSVRWQQKPCWTQAALQSGQGTVEFDDITTPNQTFVFFLITQNYFFERDVFPRIFLCFILGITKKAAHNSLSPSLFNIAATRTE